MTTAFLILIYPINVDMGSFIGYFGIYAALLKKCNVYSIEPSINAYFINLINIAKNNLRNQIDLYPFLIIKLIKINYIKKDEKIY